MCSSPKLARFTDSMRIARAVAPGPSGKRLRNIGESRITGQITGVFLAGTRYPSFVSPLAPPQRPDRPDSRHSAVTETEATLSRLDCLPRAIRNVYAARQLLYAAADPPTSKGTRLPRQGANDRAPVRRSAWIVVRFSGAPAHWLGPRFLSPRSSPARRSHCIGGACGMATPRVTAHCFPLTTSRRGCH